MEVPSDVSVPGILFWPQPILLTCSHPGKWFPVCLQNFYYLCFRVSVVLKKNAWSASVLHWVQTVSRPLFFLNVYTLMLMLWCRLANHWIWFLTWWITEWISWLELNGSEWEVWLNPLKSSLVRINIKGMENTWNEKTLDLSCEACQHQTGFILVKGVRWDVEAV